MVDRLQKWTLRGGVIEQFEYFHGRIIERQRHLKWKWVDGEV
jgi:hypothetical protein